MDTRVLELKNFKETGRILGEDEKMIKEAADMIRAGGLVAFPTETVYGLGGNALNAISALKIYKAKGRPSDNPLIVHICDQSFLKYVVKEMPEKAQFLIDKFWPGPMTLIFKKADSIPLKTTGGLDTVAVRCPAHAVANKLIFDADLPIAAPSANISGKPSATSAKHCIEDLMGRVDVILDGGESEIGLESSIIDVTGEIPVVLRPGAVTREMIEDTLGCPVELDPALKGPAASGILPKAPGMKYRHYAPSASMVLVCPKDENSLKNIAPRIYSLIRKNLYSYSRIAALASAECFFMMGISEEDLKTGWKKIGGVDIALKNMGSRNKPEIIAHDVFEDLRDCDRLGIDFIIAEGYREDRLFIAVMNRLKKAANWQIIYV